MKRMLHLWLCIALFPALASAADGTPVLGIRPSSDGAQTLGTPAYRYQGVYTMSVSDGTVAVSPQEIRNSIDNPPPSGTFDHNALDNRDMTNQHPIGAVTGLQTALAGKADESALDGKADTSVTDALSSLIDDVEDSIDTIEDTAVFYDADGNLSFNAGLQMRVAMPDNSLYSVLATDTNGDTVFGSTSKELDIYSSVRPSVTVGVNASDTVALTGDLAAYYTKVDIDTDMALKADLVSGVVPDSQLPAHIKVNNWSVDTYADLATLTAATVNDRAFVGDADPATPPADEDGTYYLIAMPPTTLTNWRLANGGTGGGGVSGIESVNGLTGPAVTIDLANFPLVQQEFLDYAKASSLATYAPLANAALTGATITTPAASAVGTEVVNAAWARTLLTSNLGSANPAMDGTASPGSATTVARSDHVHPIASNVPTATALQTARTIQTNLASATAASFNGTANVTPGVTGVLSVANGGTGVTTAQAELIRLLPNNNNTPTGVAVFSDGFTNPGYTSPSQLVWIGRDGYPAATAATATADGAAGSVVYAANNDTTSQNKAVTPAGFQAGWNARVLWGTGDPPAGTFPAGTLYLKIE